MEYQINFDKVELRSLIQVSPNEYEGVIESTNESLQASMTTKPQTREWWRELGKKIGGEFEKQVKLYTRE